MANMYALWSEFFCQTLTERTKSPFSGGKRRHLGIALDGCGCAGKDERRGMLGPLLHTLKQKWKRGLGEEEAALCTHGQRLSEGFFWELKEWLPQETTRCVKNGSLIAVRHNFERVPV